MPLAGIIQELGQNMWRIYMPPQFSPVLFTTIKVQKQLR